MKLYELNYLISADIAEKDRSLLNEEILELIKKEGGSIRTSTVSPEKKLSYTIEKILRAFLVTTVFDLEVDKIIPITKFIKDKKEIIRYLVLNKKEVSEKAKRTKKNKKEDKELSKIIKAPIKEKDKVELKKIEEKLEEILHE